MKKSMLAAFFILSLIAGCFYYPAAPGYYATGPVGGFDRSWSAAVGAFQDQGGITVQDRPSGFLQGRRYGIDVTADVRTQADGSVRVAFNTSGAKDQDPGLIDRLLGSYNRRMGR